jgi:3'(2'),5'-bisphosphate nucleotidase
MTDPLLDIALRAALAGGEAAMRVYAHAFEVTQKSDSTPVTEADLASERVIVAMLTSAFPDIPVVSEETVPEAGFESPAARFWLVDPLDGTREFVARNGEFAVLIGLVEDGHPVLGVIHGPAVGLT